MSAKETPKNAASEEPTSFETALERLESLVAELEAGDVPLEKSLQAFEEAQRLIGYCEQKLQAAEKALKQLAQDAASTLGRNSESGA